VDVLTRVELSPLKYIAVCTVLAALSCPGAAQNPIPWIDYPLHPTSIRAGAPGLTLRVTGAGFVSGSVVNWNGNGLATTFVNSRQLTAVVPGANLALPGGATITVVNPSPKGGKSNAIPFEVFREQTGVNFFPVFHATGKTPIGTVVVDLNKDGKADLVVANAGAHTLSVLLGKGDGTFQTAVNYSYSIGAQQPATLAVGDFDGDGNADIAVVSYDTNQSGGVSIMRGNGDGTLQPPGALITAGAFPRFAAAADFNGDGNLDLAVTNFNNNTVSILLGRGDLTFDSHVDYAVGSNPIKPVPVCLNYDGILDIAVTDEGGGFSTLIGHGDGTFSNGAARAVSGSPFGLAAADLNGDGLQDLVIAALSEMSVFLGAGGGGFHSGTTYGILGTPADVALGDFDSDGKLDVAVSNETGGTAALWLGNGDGTLQQPLQYSSGMAPIVIVAGDFNNDGRLDLALTDQFGGGIYVLLQDPMKLSPASLNFGTVPVGARSAPQILTISDTSGTLSLGAISISGPNASDFTFTSGCGTTLQNGRTCTLRVFLTPSATGSRSAILSVPNNTLGVTETVGLAGKGK
jgi:hypothetical protein